MSLIRFIGVIRAGDKTKWMIVPFSSIYNLEGGSNYAEAGRDIISSSFSSKPCERFLV
jgi:hypothetical protein